MARVRVFRIEGTRLIVEGLDALEENRAVHVKSG
jgi:hypothetical protein